MKFLYRPIAALHRAPFMYSSGNGWEQIWLPWNCIPYHQCKLLGYYQIGDHQYMTLDRYAEYAR